MKIKWHDFNVICICLPELFNSGTRPEKPILWVCVWTSLRTLYGVFLCIFLEFKWISFLMALMGIHMDLHIAIIPQCSLSYNLLPHGCVLPESRWPCALWHILNIKSLKAVLTVQLPLPMNLSLWALLSLSAYNLTRHTTGQDEHS